MAFSETLESIPAMVVPNGISMGHFGGNSIPFGTTNCQTKKKVVLQGPKRVTIARSLRAPYVSLYRTKKHPAVYHKQQRRISAHGRIVGVRLRCRTRESPRLSPPTPGRQQHLSPAAIFSPPRTNHPQPHTFGIRKLICLCDGRLPSRSMSFCCHGSPAAATIASTRLDPSRGGSSTPSIARLTRWRSTGT